MLEVPFQTRIANAALAPTARGRPGARAIRPMGRAIRRTRNHPTRTGFLRSHSRRAFPVGVTRRQVAGAASIGKLSLDYRVAGSTILSKIDELGPTCRPCYADYARNVLNL